MKQKFPLLFIASLVLTSCSSSNNRTALLRSYDYFLNSKMSAESLYLEANNELLEDLLDVGMPFVVYLSNEDCSYCSTFAPIMESWVKNEAYLVIKISDDIAENLDKKYVSLFSTNVEGINCLAYPSVGVVKSINECEFVNSKSFMQTKNAFLNHMKSTYKTSNVYFTHTDSISETKRSFTYISFNNSFENTKNLYNQKLLPKIKETGETIVVSDYEANDELSISLVSSTDNKNWQSDVLQITDETTDASLYKYFNC